MIFLLLRIRTDGFKHIGSYQVLSWAEERKEVTGLQVSAPQEAGVGVPHREADMPFSLCCPPFILRSPRMGTGEAIFNTY